MARQVLSARERKRRQRRSSHNQHLRRTYGITIEDYDLLFEAQGGKCAICRGGTTRRHLAVDHNHKTGEIRGLLCGLCNGGLAKFRDKRALLWRAHRYMRDGAEQVRQILGRDVRTP